MEIKFMAIKKVAIEALVTLWTEIEVEEGETLEESVYQWAKYYDEDIRLDEIKSITVLEDIE